MLLCTEELDVPGLDECARPVLGTDEDDDDIDGEEATSPGDRPVSARTVMAASLEMRLAAASSSGGSCSRAQPMPLSHANSGSSPLADVARKRPHESPCRPARPLGSASRMQRGRRMMLLASTASRGDEDDG